MQSMQCGPMSICEQTGPFAALRQLSAALRQGREASLDPVMTAARPGSHDDVLGTGIDTSTARTGSAPAPSTVPAPTRSQGVECSLNRSFTCSLCTRRCRRRTVKGAGTCSTPNTIFLWRCVQRRSRNVGLGIEESGSGRISR